MQLGKSVDGIYLPDDDPGYVPNHYCTLFIEPNKDQFAGVISLRDVYMSINESLFHNTIQFIFDKLNLTSTLRHQHDVWVPSNKSKIKDRRNSLWYSQHVPILDDDGDDGTNPKDEIDDGRSCASHVASDTIYILRNNGLLDDNDLFPNSDDS